MKKLDLESFAGALRKAVETVDALRQTETLMLDLAEGRVLGSDIVCRKNLPSFDNSAMDGFAFRHKNAGRKLAIVNTIFAGDIPRATLTENACYKIMTGAQIPSDADTVVPIEECLEVSDASVMIPEGVREGNAFRQKGEEQQKGSVLMRKGERLDFARVAMLSAQGIVAVEVVRELSIAVLSTGNEIKEPWQEASEDEIYNANAFGITALLKQYGFHPSYVGTIPDDLEQSKVFISTLKSYDVVITTGGISMGDADFLEEAFVANGLEKLFHGINVKPGRPTMMGTMTSRLGSTFVMAMPGNPMTTLLNIFLLSIPVLRKLEGDSNPYHQVVHAKLSQHLRLKPNRTNLVLGNMQDGVFRVTRDNKIGSGMLTPLMESNAVAVFEEGVSEVHEGDYVNVILW